MAKSSLPVSIRKYIRRQKALIRRTIDDPAKQREEITRLVARFHQVHTRIGTNEKANRRE
ncbi:MAG: hypothetical protein HY459_03055 [Parcubacteria group bacterium]|nr:hypothetical protein [Parcubacteria group bacterium]